MDRKRLGLLLTPSILSTVGILLVSSLVLAVATWSYGLGSGLIYNFLFGPNSSGELIQSSRSTVGAFGNTVFGNPTLNKVMYFCFWMLVGLIVYILLYLFIRGTSSAAEEAKETEYANINKSRQLKTFGLRLGIRALVAFSWVLYWIFFIKILLPFSILSSRVGLGLLPQPTGWLYGLIGLLVLTGSIYLHVIFTRLLLLRVRIFASNEVI